MPLLRTAPLLASIVLVCGCDRGIAESSCTAADGEGALSTCLSPKQSADYYAEQSRKYFDTLDASADPNSKPVYSDLVARWEWPPWLMLTGFERDTIYDSDRLMKQFAPATVPHRECRGFNTQPFGRCYVSFEIEENPCPIYEEFTFNDEGEMTFIEAWSDLPGLRPTTSSDRWAEGSEIKRLSTRVPGLGKPDGRIDLDSQAMKRAAQNDPEIADFVRRAGNFWATWGDEFNAAGPDLYKNGCGWQVDPGK